MPFAPVHPRLLADPCTMQGQHSRIITYVLGEERKQSEKPGKEPDVPLSRRVASTQPMIDHPCYLAHCAVFIYKGTTEVVAQWLCFYVPLPGDPKVPVHLELPETCRWHTAGSTHKPGHGPGVAATPWKAPCAI